MKDFAFLYAILRPIVRLTIKVFYKDVVILNNHHYPSKGPVLVCANHSNAFMDPITICSFKFRQTFFLARSDVFNTPFKKWLLTKIKIIPIYRLIEGADNLHKNQETFNLCNQLLERGNSIVLFPEGFCIQEKRLRKLKKGTARIAFGAEEATDFKLDLTIVPAALNYSKAKKFRSRLSINYGKPFKVADFKDLYLKDKVQAINAFTKHLEQEMTKPLIIVEDKLNDALVEGLEEIYLKELLQKANLKLNKTENHFKAAAVITEKINLLSVQNPKKIVHLKELILPYLKELNQLNLRDHLLNKSSIEKLNLFKLITTTIILLIGFPIHLLGLIMNYLPYKLAYSLTNKIARNIEFHASLNLAFGMFLWIFYFFAQLLIIGLCFRNWNLLLIYGAFIPFTGFYCLHYYVWLKKMKGKYFLWKIKEKNSAKMDQLLLQRSEIMKEIELLDIKL